MSSARLFALVGAVALAGCTISPPSTQSNGCDTGVLFVDWTVAGQPPSATSCAGIDHLVVTIAGSCDKVSIDPVPCTLDKFQYDGLPIGADVVEIQALDAQGNTKYQGSADVTLDATAPPSPAPIPLD